MKTSIYITLVYLLFIAPSFSQTSLVGKVMDAATGEPILFGTVAIYQKNVLLAGVETDINGTYSFSNIDPGTYDIEASYIGYTPQKQVDVIIKTGTTNRLNFNLSEGVLMDAVEVVEYKVPAIEIDYTTSGSTITAESIRSMPTKHIGAIASAPAGLTSKKDGALGIRGSRGEASVYYVDGIRVSGYESEYSTLPESGQITAGEWNDLHNWKDWMKLLDEENYSIMMDRFGIHPVNRYSVLVVNRDNAVIANQEVLLLDSDMKTIWSSTTDNSGRVELWENAFIENQDAQYIKVGREIREDIKQIGEGSNTFIVDNDCYSPEKMGIVFTVDATGSMGDEIRYLKSELLDVITRIKDENNDIDFNLGSVFYRDQKEAYLTRVSPLSKSIEETLNFVKAQGSAGGGDHPEAVDEALKETLNLNWRKDALKLVFLILDAPPHEDEESMGRIKSQIQEAAQRGIKLIPVTASGIGRETEFLMKFMAILTNGTYVFITDDSGIGNPHLDPVVDDYEVEKLNDCLVRLISKYAKSYSCDKQEETNKTEVSVYPNPATQYINVKADVVPDMIKMYSANGMMVYSQKPNEKETRINLFDFVNGIYTVQILIGDSVQSKQIILLK